MQKISFRDCLQLDPINCELFAFGTPPFSPHWSGEVPAILGVVGTLGTADTGGTSQVLSVGVDPSTGAMYVNNIGASSSGGSNVNIITGSLVGTVLGGTIQNLNSGTITALGAGTITTGTISVTIGTVTGKDANTAAQTAQPLGVGGTDSGGTIRTAFLDSQGHWRTDIPTGTITTIAAGTQNTLGTVNVVQNAGTLQGGTINNVATGTLNALASGTITGGTLQNIATGTINALANGTISTGTVQVSAGTIVRTAPASSAGSFTAAGTINLLGSNTDAASLDIQGTWVGTGFFEGQSGTSNWFALDAAKQGGIIGSQTTGNGDFYLNTAGLSGARFRLTYASGTLTYNAQTTPFEVPSTYSLGGSLTNVGMINAGTITTGSLSNIATINNGTVVIPSGTINVGTFTNLGTNINIVSGSSVGTILGGTIQNLNAGTITALGAGTITTGTVSVTIGSVVGPNAAAGTSTTAPVQIGGTTATGTVYGFLTDTAGHMKADIITGTVTTVSNLTNGSVVMTGGTLTTGTLQNLVSGTINALASGTITGGTIGNVNNGTLAIVTTVSNVTNGSVNILTGTQQLLGTLQLGTMQINPTPTIAIKPFGTIGTTGASVFGTLTGGTGAGAGTEIFVTSVSISIPSTAGSQDVSVGFGTNGGTFHAGTGRLVRGNFPAGGGIQKEFYYPVNSGTNGQLCYFQAGAGTVEIDVTYFTIASTI